MRLAIVGLAIAFTIGCASSGSSPRVGMSVGYGGNFGGPWRGHYYGPEPGYRPYPPDIELPPDIDNGPVAVPLPESPPDAGMPDFGMPEMGIDGFGL